MLNTLFEGQVDWQPVLMALIPTLLVAWLSSRAVRRLARAGLRRILGESFTPSSPLVRAPLRLLGLAVFLLVTALLLFPAFEMAGLRPRAGIGLQAFTAWLFGSGIRVLFIALLSYTLVRVTTLLVQRFEFEVARGEGLDALERAKRAKTLGAVVGKVATVMIGGIGVLMILREFRVDIGPVLAGAGIVGLAVGFGAQTLVRDIITGFFLILEDQVRVGDVAAINGTGGLVEEINLRTMVLRDLEGTVHIFPNGSITSISNRTKDFSFYVVDIGISYGEDTDRVVTVLREVGADLQADPAFAPFVLDAIEILGVDAFADSAVVIKARQKTVPLKQWEVGRELRRRIKKAFDRHGIEIPFPQRVVTIRRADATVSEVGQ